MAGTRKNITKDVVTSTIKVVAIEVVDGNIVPSPLDNIVVTGTVTQAQANRMAQKEYKGKKIAVMGVDEVRETYVLPVETFMQYATIKEAETEEA